VQSGTRSPGRAAADAGDGPDREPRGDEYGVGQRGAGNHGVGNHGPARPPGADGTLLAVVPIPGTGTSLAIVGYPVPAPGGPDAPGFFPAITFSAGAVASGPVSVGPVPVGLLGDGQVLAAAALAAAGAASRPAAGRPGLLLDHEQRRLTVDGAEVTLTFQEFELLAFLAAHPATVFSRADLVRKVWQRDFTADSRTVDVHVSRLRRKLGPDYGRCLVTEYRVGYQFRPVES
jgi:Transcriptional regulatory protein, C terminal